MINTYHYQYAARTTTSDRIFLQM